MHATSYCSWPSAVVLNERLKGKCVGTISFALARTVTLNVLMRRQVASSVLVSGGLRKIRMMTLSKFLSLFSILYQIPVFSLFRSPRLFVIFFH